MSLIKSIKQQLGLSVTPANNFTFDASADNGTMKLARNSGQDIMTVDAAGKVAFPQNTADFVSYLVAKHDGGNLFSVVSSKNCSNVIQSGTGLYGITFPSQYAGIPSVQCNCSQQGVVLIPEAVTSSGATLAAYNSATQAYIDVANGIKLHVTVVGVKA